MDSSSFDRLTRSASRLLSRRALATALGVAALGFHDVTEARKKKKRKKRKKKNQQKVVFNAFGCVNVGDFCQNDEQCCSNVCQGNECQTHDATSCQAGATRFACGGEIDVACVTTSGASGQCVTTTGNAPFCSFSVVCFDCRKDADCEESCGAGAACIPCQGECADSGGTACVSVTNICAL